MLSSQSIVVISRSIIGLEQSLEANTETKDQGNEKVDLEDSI